MLTTPRIETARVVWEADAGVVSSDDFEAMAAALVDLLASPDEARRRGANARAAAENEYDWR